MTSGPAYIFGSIWPRISPPGLAAVWTLAYHLPAIRSAAWAGVSVAWPSIGLAADAKGRTTAAFAPALAGPWKWAAVAGPLRPSYVILYLSTLVSLLSQASARPLPRVMLGG